MAALAGFIDAVGYLTLRHLFTAHMSGNSARLGVHLGHLDLRQTQPVGLFIFGIALATVLLELAARRGVRSITALLLATFIAYGTSVIGQGFYGGRFTPRARPAAGRALGAKRPGLLSPMASPAVPKSP